MTSNPYPLRAVKHQMLHQSHEGQYLKLDLECGHEELRHVSDKTFEEPSKLKIPKRVRCAACPQRSNYGTMAGKRRPPKKLSFFARIRARISTHWKRLKENGIVTRD